MKLAAALSLAIAATAATPVHAMDDAALAGVVRQRLDGDRTGACMAVAVVEKAKVSRSFQCADPADAGRIGADSTFGIGSVSKPMTATHLPEQPTPGKR